MKYPEARLWGEKYMHKGIAGKEWKLHQFAPITPTVHLRDKRQKGHDTLVLQLSSDHFFIPGPRLNRIPMGAFRSREWHFHRRLEQLTSAAHSSALKVTSTCSHSSVA
jgi:hypothetical protein